MSDKRFLSVCSGIDAASVAWNPLGWRAHAFSEIEDFPCQVLSHHYPAVPNWGDMTKFKEWPDANFDVLCGGTPCQSFSVAGLRAGLDDPRGNLMLTYGAIAARYRPRWLVWENVAGVLSSGKGRDFAAFLGLLTGKAITAPASGWGKCGSVSGIADAYGIAWRLFDAQYFGVAQRRRRVFVVGYLGDWRPAAAVLFERHSLQGNPPPRREARATTFHDISPSIGASGRGFSRTGETRGQDPVIAMPISILEANARQGKDHHSGLGDSQPGDPMFTLQASKQHAVYNPPISASLGAKGGSGHMDSSTETFIASPILGKPYADRGAGDAGLIFHTLRGEGFDASEDGTGRGTPLVPAASPIAFDPTQITSAQNRSNPQPGDPCHTLAKGAHAPAIAFNLRGREGGAMPEVSNVASLRAAPGGSSRSYVTAFHGTQDPDISGDVTHPMGRNQGQEQAALIGSAVRRLTPRECEFLQGFPADYTLIPTKARKKMEDDMLAYIQRTYPNMDRMEAERLAKDGPRYKALGNSWAVPNARWIGERIDMVDQLIDSKP